MDAEYVSPEYVDQKFNLPHGRTARLVRKGLLPGIVMPDGTIRIGRATIKLLEQGLAASRPTAGEAAPSGA
jgi:hypothetical protein